MSLPTYFGLRTTFVILLLTLNVFAYAQTTQKIYYTDQWIVTENTTAPFYRIVNRDAQGQITGKVKDYYSNGTLQWEGYLTYIDSYDNSKDLHSGIAIWYHPNGKKSRESNYVDNKLHGTTRYWDEKGFLTTAIDYVNGTLHGNSIQYHPSSSQISTKYFYNNNLLDGPQYTYYDNGKLNSEILYTKGKLADYWVTYHNVIDNKKVYRFMDDFRDTTNPHKYTLTDSDLAQSKITSGGLLMTTKNSTSMAAWFNAAKSKCIVSGVAATIEFITKDPSTGTGFAFLFKDWNNYNYVIIQRGGYAKVGIVKNGQKKEAYRYVSSIKDVNTVDFFYDGDYYMTINGQEIKLEEFEYDMFSKFSNSDLNFTGSDLVGPYLTGTKAKVKFTSFTVEMITK